MVDPHRAAKLDWPAEVSLLMPDGRFASGSLREPVVL